jgi:hypothetical protein
MPVTLTTWRTFSTCLTFSRKQARQNVLYELVSVPLARPPSPESPLTSRTFDGVGFLATTLTMSRAGMTRGRRRIDTLLPADSAAAKFLRPAVLRGFGQAANLAHIRNSLRPSVSPDTRGVFAREPFAIFRGYRITISVTAIASGLTVSVSCSVSPGSRRHRSGPYSISKRL